MLHEVAHGACDAKLLGAKSEDGGFKVPVILVTDSESFFNAVTNIGVQVPTEVHMAYTATKIG